jgi:hypothetical protein
MKNKNQTLERKFITLIIINNLKCIILVDGFYSVTTCSLRERSRGTSSEQREGSLGASLRLAQLAPALGPEPVGVHGGENSVFLCVLARREFLLLLKLRPAIRAVPGPAPQPRDVAEHSGIYSFVAALHAGEVLPLAWSAHRRR